MHLRTEKEITFYNFLHNQRQIFCRSACLAEQRNFSIRSHLLTLLHSERPKLYGVLAVLSAKGLKQEYATSGANRKG